MDKNGGELFHSIKVVFDQLGFLNPGKAIYSSHRVTQPHTMRRRSLHDTSTRFVVATTSGGPQGVVHPTLIRPGISGELRL